MSRIEGKLRLQPSGRWAICRRGRDPWEITSGEVIYVQVAGKIALQATRIEFAHRAQFEGEYVSMDGYPLKDGLRAALGDNGD
jgi:hypothetical protein